MGDGSGGKNVKEQAMDVVGKNEEENGQKREQECRQRFEGHYSFILPRITIFTGFFYQRETLEMTVLHT